MTSLALLHLMSVMSTMEIAHVVKCTPPDNVISAVRDFTPFLNVKVGRNILFFILKKNAVCANSGSFDICYRPAQHFL